jgi:hypothetical protein
MIKTFTLQPGGVSGSGPSACSR